MLDSKDELKPQQALEKILQLEVEIAGKVAAAKEDSENKITEIQNNSTELKNQIIVNARTQRDKDFEEGIEKAHAMSDERLKKARSDAEKFVKVSRGFEDEAVAHVLDIVLKTDDKEVIE